MESAARGPDDEDGDLDPVQTAIITTAPLSASDQGLFQLEQLLNHKHPSKLSRQHKIQNIRFTPEL